MYQCVQSEALFPIINTLKLSLICMNSCMSVSLLCRLEQPSSRVQKNCIVILVLDSVVEVGLQWLPTLHGMSEWMSSG